MGVLNTALYYTKVCLGFSFKHEKVDIPENALDIIRKYEKIQEIFDRYDKGELTHHMFGLFVGEVLEDDKI